MVDDTSFMTTTKRTDIHRPSAIIPADYQYVTSYHLATTVDGWPVPPYNVDYVIELRHTHTFARTGGLGKCSICGANFIYGDVWCHEPTGEHLHVGQDCAAKYEMMADRSAFEVETDRRKATAVRSAIRAEEATRRAGFLAAHPGLEAALAVEHNIIADIASRFRQYGNLSEKQIALVMKIAAEATTPRAVEQHVAAPTGRQTFRGVVVSAKAHEGSFGIESKMTVKVTTLNGTWLAWSTIPAALLDTVPVGEQGRYANLRGAEVEITATLSPGKDAHFAFAKRPVGKVVRYADGVVA